jgi:Family of unknown function (DUF5706)
VEALRRMLFGSPVPPAPPTLDPKAEAIENAWLIHGSIVAWTANVDQKASFSLAIESAVLVAVGGFTKSGSLYGDLDRSRELVPYSVGVALLVLAVICAGSVVKPRLRSRRTRLESHDNFIYFGHLRHWDADRLSSMLRSADMLAALSQQLVAMSDIAWRKHRSVQISLWLGFCGFGSLCVAALFNMH